MNDTSPAPLPTDDCVQVPITMTMYYSGLDYITENKISDQKTLEGLLYATGFTGEIVKFFPQNSSIKVNDR